MAAPNRPNLTPNNLVTTLAGGIGIPDTAGNIVAATPNTLATDSTPELVTFVGYLGAQVAGGATKWRLLYLDWALQECLLVQETGIVHADAITPQDAPFNQLDVIWVERDTPVVRSAGSLSTEGQFLSGAFTRAGDFEAAPTGGTLSASTGVFCEARSPGCCRCTVYTR